MEQNNETKTRSGAAPEQQTDTKFCRECGAKISKKAVVCPKCGCSADDSPKQAQPQIVIQNTNQNQQVQTGAMDHGRKKNKWVAFFLCMFFGVLGAHKFYEGKVGRGILYLFTGGLFGIGVIIDFFSLLFRSNPYYV